MVVVNDTYIVKFRVWIEMAEGKNMIFVSNETKVPVPKVYALFSKDGKGYTVMEDIAGETTLPLWPQLSLSEKEVVSRQLREHWDELRNLTPSDFYGSLDRQPFLDSIFWTDVPVPAINGPVHARGRSG